MAFGAIALTIWNLLAAGVYVFALIVALTLASGGLEPVGLAYYGVGADWRMPVLLALLAALQALWIGDAIVLGRRLRSVTMWAVLILAAIVGPFAMVVVLGQIDGWRYDHRSGSRLTNLGAGVAMVFVVVAIYVLRHRAFRATARRVGL
jgi:hypothetical protein